MIRSESLGELNAALSAAQGEFEAVSKTANNPFFKSKYADLAGVVKAAAPIVSKHGLAVWQAADVDDAGELLWTVLLHLSGEYIGSTSRLLPVKNDPQAQGSATTYQRRYQYMAALGLVADEDDDGNAAVSAGNRKPVSRAKSRSKATAPPPAERGPDGPENGSQTTDGTLVTPDQLKQLRATFDASGQTDEQLCWFLLSVGVESLPENPDKPAIGAAMRSLTLEQAFKLDALLKGEDESVPGAS